MHNIQEWFDKQRLESEQYLLKLGFHKVLNNKIYKGLIPSSKNFIQSLSIELMQGFPLEYPKVYIDFGEDFYGKYLHIESYLKDYGNYICLFNEKNKQTFYNEGIKLLNEALIRATDFLNNIDKQQVNFSKDVLDEFDAYWRNDKSYFSILNDDINNNPFELIVSESYNRNLISVSQQKNKKYFQDISGFSNPKIDYNHKAIFLPIFMENYKIPNENKELLEIIKNTDYLTTLNNYIKSIDLKKQTILYLIFPINKNDSKKIGISINITAIKTNINRYFHSKKFQEKSISIFEYMVLSTAMKTLKRHNIIDINYQRIFQRGGSKEQVESILNISTSIVIVGCGSLGSLLSYKLAKSGILTQILIDGDTLTYDNIARHQLGANVNNRNKANALSEELTKQFPLSSCESKPYYFQRLNSESFNSILKSDLIIISTGDEAEAMIFFLLEFKRVYGHIPDIIITWFEAFAVVGHALLINEENINSHNKIRENINIMKEDIDKVAITKEVGCVNSYSSYTFIDSDFIVNGIARFILNYFKGSLKSNCISIIGDIENYSRYIREDTDIEEIKSFSILDRNLKDIVNA